MLPTGLSMLWEPVDPDVALRDRFGFRGFGAAADWITDALGTGWGVPVLSCRRLVISGPNAIAWVDTGERDLVVKWSVRKPLFAGLAASTELLRRLGEQGLPVAAPLTARDGRVRVEMDAPAGPVSVALLPELAGDWLDVSDEAAVRAAGACLARLHAALGGYADVRPWRASDLVPLRRRMEDWRSVEDRATAAEAFVRLDRLLAGLPVLHDEPQLVHNDFRGANVLTRDSAVVGVLDFDDVAWDHRVYDLAKASVYLSTRFTDWGPTTVAVRRLLRSGYESVRPLSAAEGQWYEALRLWLAIGAVPAGPDPAGWAQAV